MTKGQKKAFYLKERQKQQKYIFSEGKEAQMMDN